MRHLRLEEAKDEVGLSQHVKLLVVLDSVDAQVLGGTAAVLERPLLTRARDLGDKTAGRDARRRPGERLLVQGRYILQILAHHCHVCTKQ